MIMQLTIDINDKTTPFPHYWERCVGSGHALLGLREDWRAHLKKCHEELGFEYVRFHGLLCDDMSVYSATRKDSHFSFFNIDSIFDFLISINMKPLVELSFMPRDISSGADTVFHYRANITPPNDYTKWVDLIKTLTKHLVDRYGVEEVRKWPFEVWNEPNLKEFWSGTQEEYFKLYRYSAEAVKNVDSQILVGGPATARNAWIPEFREYCEKNNVPYDFISTHHYPTDAALAFDMDMEEQMARSKRGVLKKMAIKARQESGDYPLYYTEWNTSAGLRDRFHDEPYAAAFVAKAIVDNVGLVDTYSFWTFSDIFEEHTQSSRPFHGCNGLQTIHGIPKPTYRAFQLLHALGNERLPVIVDKESTTEAVATKNNNGIKILLYNHNIPRAPISTENVELFIKGAGVITSATLEKIDESHANPKKHWVETGSPEYLNNSAVETLIEKSKIERHKIKYESFGEDIVINISLPPHGIAAITLG